MKKTFVTLALTSMVAFSSFAQKDVVKAVKGTLTGGGSVPQLVEALNKLEPALTNPETAQDAYTWLLAGQGYMKIYDQIQVAQMTGNSNPDDTKQMGEALMKGYNHLEKALSLDTVYETKNGEYVINKKTGERKYKAKYSNEIIGLLNGHISDFSRVGNAAIGAEDWATAYDAYRHFCEVAASPRAKAANINIPDSTLAEVSFFQGYSAYQIKEYAKAYPAFAKAQRMGYTGNNIDAFATSALANMIQGTLDAKDYAKAYAILDKNIAEDPDNAALYDMKGIVIENDTTKGVKQAIDLFRKATQVNPNYAQGYYDTGRALYLIASDLISENPKATTAEMAPKLIPIYEEALPLFNKAIELDSNLADQANRIIDDINYKLEQLRPALTQ